MTRKGLNTTDRRILSFLLGSCAEGPVPLSHPEIGQVLGRTRQTVAISLRKLKSLGLIESQRELRPYYRVLAQDPGDHNT